MQSTLEYHFRVTVGNLTKIDHIKHFASLSDTPLYTLQSSSKALKDFQEIYSRFLSSIEGNLNFFIYTL